MAISTEIEIAALPNVVRETLLDFKSIPEWHSGLIKSITPLSKDAGTVTAEGGKLRCVMEGFAFDSTITANTPSTFTWQGPPVFGLIAGLHTFEFNPSKCTPGGTTFVQKESYTGIGTFLMTQPLLGWKTKANFAKFNEDLKKRVEAK